MVIVALSSLQGCVKTAVDGSCLPPLESITLCAVAASGKSAPMDDDSIVHGETFSVTDRKFRQDFTLYIHTCRDDQCSGYYMKFKQRCWKLPYIR